MQLLECKTKALHNHLDPSLLSIDQLTYLHRSKASHGLWMSGLLPFCYCLVLSAGNNHCQDFGFATLLSIQTGISSLLILQTTCNLFAKDDKIDFKRLKKFGKGIFFFDCLPPLINIFFIVYFTDVHPLSAFCSVFICLYIQIKFVNWLFTNFGKSFTIGEALMAGEVGALVLTLSLFGTVRIPSKLASEEEQIMRFVRTSLITCSICGFIIWRNRTRMTCTALFGLLFVMGCFGLCASSVVLNFGCLPWLFHLINSSLRISLINWWLSLSVLIFVVGLLSQRNSSITLTVMRKTFHVLVGLIFFSGIILDPPFTYLASSGATIFFLLLEMIRVCQINPISDCLNSMFSCFLDEKDEGPLVLSHIYLLCGLSCPLWIYPCHLPQSYYFKNPSLNTTSSIGCSVLALMAGIISVGIGDTMASVGGTYLGRHKWPGTKKTVEGTASSIVSQMAFIAVIFYLRLMNATFGLAFWLKLLLSVTVNALVEAFTDQVDNLVLPFILFTLLMVL